MRSVTDSPHTSHLPHADGEPYGDASGLAKRAPHRECIDDRLTNAKDVRDVAADQQYVSVLTPLRHSGYHRRRWVAGRGQRVRERRALPVNIRVKVEHPFRVLKRQFGYTNTDIGD
jgi:hypothetical protein